MNRSLQLLLAFVVALLVAAPGPAMAKRVALVIANTHYKFAPALGNPGSDARLIAGSLRNAGFETVDVMLDLDRNALESALRAFGQRAEGAEVAMVYYAGHGIEAGGQNYLIPTDAKLERDRDLEVEATRLDTVMLMGEGARLRIIVLDACRNNPFLASMQRTMRNRAVGRGLAAVEPEGETLVVYSAKAGATAADGEGANSPFAESLARRIAQPGLEISLLFRSVRDDVLAKTGRVQEPFTYGSLSGNSFYFVPGKEAASANASAAPPSVPTMSKETSEALFWQGTVNANSAPAYRDYLKRYPTGTYSGLANENLARLATPAAPVEKTKAAPIAPTPATGVVGAGLALPSLGNAFAALPPDSGSIANGDPAERFSFRPSTQIRQRALTTFIGQMKTANPQMGSILELAFATSDVFATVDTEISRKYDLTTSNLAVTFALFFDALRDCANGRTSDFTRTQAQAVRRQMALVLAASPQTSNLTEAQRQEYSDALLLNAAFLSLALESAQKGTPAARQAFADNIAGVAKQSFGVDLRAIRVTDEGYKFAQ